MYSCYVQQLPWPNINCCQLSPPYSKNLKHGFRFPSELDAGLQREKMLACGVFWESRESWTVTVVFHTHSQQIVNVVVSSSSSWASKTWAEQSSIDVKKGSAKAQFDPKKRCFHVLREKIMECAGMNCQPLFLSIDKDTIRFLVSSPIQNTWQQHHVPWKTDWKFQHVCQVVLAGPRPFFAGSIKTRWFRPEKMQTPPHLPEIQKSCDAFITLSRKGGWPQRWQDP